MLEQEPRHGGTAPWWAQRLYPVPTASLSPGPRVCVGGSGAGRGKGVLPVQSTDIHCFGGIAFITFYGRHGPHTVLLHQALGSEEIPLSSSRSLGLFPLPLSWPVSTSSPPPSLNHCPFCPRNASPQQAPPPSPHVPAPQCLPESRCQRSGGHASGDGQAWFPPWLCHFPALHGAWVLPPVGTFLTFPTQHLAPSGKQHLASPLGEHPFCFQPS